MYYKATIKFPHSLGTEVPRRHGKYSSVAIESETALSWEGKLSVDAMLEGNRKQSLPLEVGMTIRAKLLLSGSDVVWYLPEFEPEQLADGSHLREDWRS